MIWRKISIYCRVYHPVYYWKNCRGVIIGEGREEVILKDLNKANEILTEFEKVAKKYPAKSEIESEREIIEIIKIIGAK